MDGDVHLTPTAGFETRSPARVTGVGIASLVRVFIGLTLGVISLALIARVSRRKPIVAIIASVPFIPAFLAEQTGEFSSLRPPAAIETIEIAPIVIVAIVIVFSSLLLQRDATKRRPG